MRTAAPRWWAVLGLTGTIFATACNGSASANGSGTFNPANGSATGAITVTGDGVPGGSATYSGTATLGDVNPAATPELGSLTLFGTGAVGMAGYALARLRARRRP